VLVVALTAGIAPMPTADASSVPEQLILRVRAFIPQSKIRGPSLISKIGCEYKSDYFYGGDGRTYDPVRGSSRVELDVGIRWDGRPRMTGYHAFVGRTHVYRDGVLVSQWQASRADVWAKQLGGDANRIDLRINMRAKNPYCTMGYVEGVFTMTFYRDGRWWIRSGGHRAMPNWEIYTRRNDAAYRMVHHTGYTGAACLAWKIEICQQSTLTGLVGDWK
jgi:hypothetical protein